MSAAVLVQMKGTQRSFQLLAASVFVADDDTFVVTVV